MGSPCRPSLRAVPGDARADGGWMVGRIVLRGSEVADTPNEMKRCRRKACRRKAEMSRRKAEMVRDVAEKAEMSPKKAETPKSAKRRGCRRKAEKAFMCRRKAKLEDRHTNKPKLGLSTTQAWFTRTPVLHFAVARLQWRCRRCVEG